MTRIDMGRARDEAALGYLSPDAMRDIAAKAFLHAYGFAKKDPVRSEEMARFGADLMRASLPEQAAS